MKLSDLLRQAADMVDDLEGSAEFIKADMKRNLVRYANDIKANAALKARSEELKDVSFENIDGAKLLKESHGRTNPTKAYFSNGQPWWTGKHYSGRSGG